MKQETGEWKCIDFNLLSGNLECELRCRKR